MELQPYRAAQNGLPSAPAQRALGAVPSLNIALLVDFDNVILGVEDPGFDIELVVDALHARGVVVLGRAYGDWYRHNRHRRKLMENGIELVETPVFGPLIKNSADIRIVLDAFEMGMTQPHIDTFCLVSGDSDFLPLIKKLQALGKHVIVIAGNKFTSDLVRRNCNEFVSYENLYAEAMGIEDPTTLEGAFALLERALQTFAERGAEARSSAIKQMMVQLNGAFSERNFGYTQFRGFLDRAARAGVVRLGGREGSSSGEQLVFLPGDTAPESNSSSVNGSNANGSAANGSAAVVATYSATPTADSETTEEAPNTNVRRRRRRRRANGVIETVNDDITNGEDTSSEAVSIDETSFDAVETLASDIVTEANEVTEPIAVDAPETELANALDTTETPRYETMNNTGQNLLLGRNVRRGSLRFSARKGTQRLAPAVQEETPAEPSAAVPATEALDRDPVEVGVETGDAVMAEIALSEPAQEAADALALTTEVPLTSEAEDAEARSALAGEAALETPSLPDEPALATDEASVPQVGASEGLETATLEEPSATPQGAIPQGATPETGAEAEAPVAAPSAETTEDVDASATTPDPAPKRRRRPTRRKTTAVAEKSLPETAPADEAEAARNEADATAMGVTFPGATFQIIESDATAPEGGEVPSSTATPLPEVVTAVVQPTEVVTDTEPDAGQVQRVDTADNPPIADAVAPDVVAAGEAIVASLGEDADEAAARKPRRGRRGGTRRRTTASAGNEAGEGTGGDQSPAGAGESASGGDDAASPTTSN